MAVIQPSTMAAAVLPAISWSSRRTGPAPERISGKRNQASKSRHAGQERQSVPDRQMIGYSEILDDRDENRVPRPVVPQVRLDRIEMGSIAAEAGEPGERLRPIVI